MLKLRNFLDELNQNRWSTIISTIALGIAILSFLKENGSYSSEQSNYDPKLSLVSRPELLTIMFKKDTTMGQVNSENLFDRISNIELVWQIVLFPASKNYTNIITNIVRDTSDSYFLRNFILNETELYLSEIKKNNIEFINTSFNDTTEILLLQKISRFKDNFIHNNFSFLYKNVTDNLYFLNFYRTFRFRYEFLEYLTDTLNSSNESFILDVSSKSTIFFLNPGEESNDYYTESESENIISKFEEKFDSN